MVRIDKVYKLKETEEYFIDQFDHKHSKEILRYRDVWLVSRIYNCRQLKKYPENAPVLVRIVPSEEQYASRPLLEEFGTKKGWREASKEWEDMCDIEIDIYLIEEEEEK